MKKCPICEKCGGQIDPYQYDGCDMYFISDGRILCKECFIEEETEFLRDNTVEFARLIGARVRYQ